MGRFQLHSGKEASPGDSPALAPSIADTETDSSADFNLADPAMQEKLLIQMGPLSDDENSVIALTPETLFGRHCALLGTTGAGKSWTLARLVEECSRFNSRIILLDASGEYHRLGQGVSHVSVGDRDALDGRNVTVPYYQLRESDLFAIFKPNGPSQGPKLRSAMISLKLARHAHLLAPDGTIPKAHRSKVEYEKARQEFSAKLENPYCDFEIRYLPLQIQHECVDPQRSAAEPLVWGGPNGLELSHCVTLINRIQDMIASPNLASIFRPEGMPSLFDEISMFLMQNRYRVLRVSLKNLPFEHNTREIVGNAIGRHLLELGRAGSFKKRPLLVCVDEAHQFLARTIRESNEHFPLDSFGLIAKEGRKYALNICLSTQRPRDIPEDVLSQVGMFVIHRLTNEHDLDIVERASGHMTQQILSNIPDLAAGEALIVGINLPNPIFVRMNPPASRPDSQGPDFQKFWRLPIIINSEKISS